MWQHQNRMCGAELGLAELASCSAVGTWTGWIQDQVQKWFNCLPGTEPDLINTLNPSWLCRDLSRESLVARLLHQKGFIPVMCREASGSTESQTNCWFGPSSTWLSSRQALQIPSGIWALHPARGGIGHLQAGAMWALDCVWCGTNARSPGDGAGEVWSQPESSRTGMEKPLPAKTACVWRYAP